MSALGRYLRLSGPPRHAVASRVRFIMFCFWCLFFLNARSQSSLGRSPWNFATWSESRVFFEI